MKLNSHNGFELIEIKHSKDTDCNQGSLMRETASRPNALTDVLAKAPLLAAAHWWLNCCQQNGEHVHEHQATPVAGRIDRHVI